MSTLKYKATERYSVGWTDPRASFGQSNGEMYFPCIDTEGGVPTEFTDATTETLRDLWMVRWGKRAVDHVALRDAEKNEDPIIGSMQELANRHLVTFEMVEHVDRAERDYYYVLKREANANR